MKQLLFVGLIAFSAYCEIASATCDGLVGTWNFVSEINKAADGTIVNVNSPSAGYAGTLVYTADGHVSAILMPKGRVWAEFDATDKQLRDTVMALATTAYTGTYTVDHVNNIVTHHVMTSIDPRDEGRNLIRRCQLTHDQLQLSGSWTFQGRELTFIVTWKR